MRIVYNPPKPEGANINKVGFKGLTDEKGWQYEIPAGRALKFRDDVAEFLLETFGFLREVDSEGKVIFTDGKITAPVKDSGLKPEAVEEFKPTKEVPNLVERKLYPEKYDGSEEETSGPDFYGEGLADDTPDSGWVAPKSRFTKE